MSILMGPGPLKHGPTHFLLKNIYVMGQFNGLLTNKTDFDQYPELPWPILNSMRHVDGETNISINGSG